MGAARSAAAAGTRVQRWRGRRWGSGDGYCFPDGEEDGAVAAGSKVVTLEEKVAAPVRGPTRCPPTRRNSERTRAGDVSSSGSVAYSVVEDEEVDEGEEETVRPRLELIKKPDWSLALLDEYASEELGASLCANHSSGYVVVLGKLNVSKCTLIN